MADTNPDPTHQLTAKRLVALMPEAAEISYDNLVELVRLAEALMLVRPHEDAIWTSQRAARYLDITLKHYDELMQQPGAPRPLVERYGLTLWRAGDLFAFLDRHGARHVCDTSTDDPADPCTGAP
jgi:hypothetical protein